MDTPVNNTRRRMGNVLIGLCSFLLIFSSSLKFAHVPKVVAEMSSIGYRGDLLLLIAVLELLTALVFLTPVTRSVGLLVFSSYLGGAIASHIASGQYRAIITPGVCLGLAWIGTWLRHPQMLWSVGSRLDSSLCQSEVARASGDSGMAFMKK